MVLSSADRHADIREGFVEVLRICARPTFLFSVPPSDRLGIGGINQLALESNKSPRL